MSSIFSLNLKNYRLKNKLTLQEFSEKLQISRTALSGYEKGINEPNLYGLLKIASVLDCSLDELVGVSNPKNKLDKIVVKTEENIDCSSELTSKIKTLNSLIDKNRRTFEDLSKSQKRSSYLINELTMSKKRADRMLDELTMSKKRNDLIFEELKRSVNRLSKTEELFKDVSSELLSIIDNKDSINKFNTEISSEIMPNIIEFKTKKSGVEYRSIDIVGKVSAGSPYYACEEIIGKIDIPQKFLCSSKTYFILEIKGDSMNNLFNNGDFILIEKTNMVNNLDLVIAFLPDNEEATFKKINFSIDSPTINLIPESSNPIHKVQTYSVDDVLIIGKVLGSISEYIVK